MGPWALTVSKRHARLPNVKMPGYIGTDTCTTDDFIALSIVNRLYTTVSS